jgi:hypothetical protein
MKKLVSALSLTSYLLLAPSAFADTLCPPANGNFSTLCNQTLGTLIGPLVSLIFVIAVVAALLYLVYGGFKWLTSGGDKSAVAAAREHIIAAIIGLVIIFLSYFILNIVVRFFIPNFAISTFNLPTL